MDLYAMIAELLCELKRERGSKMSEHKFRVRTKLREGSREAQ
jgi:hypothetical protein